MWRTLLAPAVLAFTVSLLGQTSPSPVKPAEHLTSACIVEGRVVAAVDGTPLKSARVSLVPEHAESRKPQTYAATTDGDGHFLLKDVVPGRYRFLAARVGYVDQQYQAKGMGEGAVLSLKPGERVSGVLFHLIVSGVITGRVINEDGDVMVRIGVVALRRPSDDEIEDQGGLASRKLGLQPVASAQTDDRGQYRIFGLNPGDYYIKATDSIEFDFTGANESYGVLQGLGTEYAPAYYPGVVQASQAQTVSVKAGDEVQADVLMQRTKTAEVGGHVIGRHGPAKNAWVSLIPLGADAVGSDRQDRCDETGAFRLKGIPPGSYVVGAYEQDEGEESYELQGQQKVEVSGENIDSLVISLSAGTALQGRVTVAGAGSPALNRMQINLSDTDEGSSGMIGSQGRVKKDGTFEIRSVRDGDYAFTFWGLENNWYVKSVRRGGDDVLENGLQVEVGNSGGRLDVVISSGSAQLEGTVSGRDGPVIGAHVRIMPEPEPPYNRSRLRNVRTDQVGRFSLTGLTPGTYGVVARSSATSASGTLRSDLQTVTLSERDRKTLQLTIDEPIPQ